jgi:hypothetical protein
MCIKIYQNDQNLKLNFPQRCLHTKDQAQQVLNEDDARALRRQRYPISGSDAGPCKTQVFPGPHTASNKRARLLMVESMPNQTEFSRITSLADGCPFVACGNQGRATLWRNWVQPKRHSSMFKPVGFRNVLCPAGLVIVLLRAGSANP